MYRALDRKHLPRAGGFEDQPELQMQVILLLENLLGKVTKQNGNKNGAGGDE